MIGFIMITRVLHDIKEIVISYAWLRIITEGYWKKCNFAHTERSSIQGVPKK